MYTGWWGTPGRKTADQQCHDTLKAGWEENAGAGDEFGPHPEHHHWSIKKGSPWVALKMSKVTKPTPKLSTPSPHIYCPFCSPKTKKKKKKKPTEMTPKEPPSDQRAV